MKKLFSKKLSKAFHRQKYSTVTMEDKEIIIIKPGVDSIPATELLSDDLDLSGVWETPYQEVALGQKGRNAYHGMWGVNMLSFELRGVRITDVHLGAIDLLFGGDVSPDCSTIEWDNGQIWVRV